MKRTAGIGEKLFERLVAILAREIYEELASHIFRRASAPSTDLLKLRQT